MASHISNGQTKVGMGSGSTEEEEDFNPYLAYIGAGIFLFTVVNYLTR